MVVIVGDMARKAFRKMKACWAPGSKHVSMCDGWRRHQTYVTVHDKAQEILVDLMTRNQGKGSGARPTSMATTLVGYVGSSTSVRRWTAVATTGSSSLGTSTTGSSHPARPPPPPPNATATELLMPCSSSALRLTTMTAMSTTWLRPRRMSCSTRRGGNSG
jgi:hypothetical protein